MTPMTLALIVCALLAQVPNPVAAINAAKDAKAKTEAAQKKNSEALDPAPAAPQGAPKPAEQKPAEQKPGGQAPAAQPPAEQPAPGAAGGYTYDPAGRRDPFVSLIGRGGDVPVPGAVRPQGLPGVLISEMTLKGVLRTPKGDFVALLQSPDGKSFVGHTGDKVLDGAIKTITAAEVVFTQDVNDPLSLVKQREVRKGIRPEAR